MAKFDPLQTPALAHVVEQLYFAQQGASIAIASGMGVDPAILHFSKAEVNAMYQQVQIARAQQHKSWRGLYIAHIAKQAGSDYRQFDVLAALDAASSHLSQQALDFLTLRDVPDAKLNCLIAPMSDNPAASFYAADAEAVKLTMAFRQQMVTDAAPHRQNIAVGAYVLMREPLPTLDALIKYDYLRMVITRAGIAVSIVVDDPPQYIPLWWSPENDTNTSQIFVPANVRFAIDVLMASIWRDACIVEDAFAQERGAGKGYQRGKASSHRPQHDNPVRLPRIIYKSRWGSPDDRAAADAIARRAHVVRGHYRELAPGRAASEAALDAADSYGYPQPPAGYTFVRPHTRGDGEPDTSPRRVICKGLQVAKTLLA